MTRQLAIIFGQRDYNQQLGTIHGATIAEFGCYITSFATLARACGKQTDPVELNKIFTERGIYVNGDLITDDDLTKVYPDIVYQQSYYFPNEVRNPDGSIKTPAIPADLTLLKELMSDPTTWVLIEISLPHAPFTHFVLCTGINGSISIADPMTKTIDDFSIRYGDPAQSIIKYIVYKGLPISSESINDSLRVERDQNWNGLRDVVSYLGIDITPEDKGSMVVHAKEKIDSLIQQISQYKKEAEDNFKKYEDELTKNIALNEANKKISDDNQDHSEAAYDAEHKVNDLKKDKNTFVEEVSKTLGLQYDPTNDKNILQEVVSEIITLQENKKPEPVPEVQHEVLLASQAPAAHGRPSQPKPYKSLIKTILGIFFTFE